MTPQETKRLYEAMHRIKNDPSLEDFVKHLTTTREGVRAALETCPPEMATVLQGKAQAYSQLLKMFDETAEILDKLG